MIKLFIVYLFGLASSALLGGRADATFAERNEITCRAAGENLSTSCICLLLFVKERVKIFNHHPRVIDSFDPIQCD